MNISVKLTAILAGLAFSVSGAMAQDVTSVLAGVSPIPEGAKEDYCYYNGLAYSPNSYLPITIPTREKLLVAAAGGQAVEAEGGDVRVILMQCVDAEAVGRDECSSGGMAWAVRQNVAVSPRVER